MARDQGGAANTFASSYPAQEAYSYCNGLADSVSIARLAYREALVAPPLNGPAQAGASCKALRAAGATVDGNYWVQNPPGSPVVAYCDMTHDGGGWTAIFSGRNGSRNVFDRFDAGSHAGICTDPQTHCLRRAPAALANGSFAVSCGGAFVKFPATPAMSAYFTSGTQADWTTIAPTVVAGSVANPPNSLFTGSGATRGWIFARNNGGGSNTFAQSFDSGTFYDYCNGVFDNATIAHVYYREQ